MTPNQHNPALLIAALLLGAAGKTTDKPKSKKQ